MQTVRLDIEGMTCATCVARLEKALRAVRGVTSVSVNLASESAAVELVLGAASVRDLTAAVAAAGYAATVPGDSQAAVPVDRTRGLRRDALLALALALPLLAGTHLSLIGIESSMPAWLQWLLATPVQFWCARRFYVAAFKAVRAGAGNMDLLVSLGTAAAYGLSLVPLARRRTETICDAVIGTHCGAGWRVWSFLSPVPGRRSDSSLMGV